jgi:ABC-2 type transport system ATP-binding protein
MDQVVLELSHLSKNYGSLAAVQDVSLQVHQGEIFGLLGPNGAGKTTTINMVCGLTKADGGDIVVLGRKMTTANRKDLAVVGVCSQQNILWEKLTCLEQMVFMGEMYKMNSSIARHRSVELLAQLGLAEKQDQLAGNLSGGMQRRLNFAMALVHDPEIVMLDEPEAGLDPQSRVMVRDYIRNMARNKTVILTTHNMDEADRLADRVAIIDHGRLLTLDTPEELKRTVGEGDVLELDLAMISPEKAMAVASQLGMSVSSANHTLILRARGLFEKLPAILDALKDAGAEIGEARMRANTLEDVFISLTGRKLRE